MANGLHCAAYHPLQLLVLILILDLLLFLIILGLILNLLTTVAVLKQLLVELHYRIHLRLGDAPRGGWCNGNAVALDVRAEVVDGRERPLLNQF